MQPPKVAAAKLEEKARARDGNAVRMAAAAGEQRSCPRRQRHTPKDPASVLARLNPMRRRAIVHAYTHTPGQAEQDVDREADEPDAFLRWRLEAQLPTEIPASREQLKGTAPGLRCLRLLLW